MRSSLSAFLRLVLVLVVFGSEHARAQTGEPVTLFSMTGSIHGTLTMPASGPASVVALIICGSGPTDRDGNTPFMKNNCMKMLADSLAASGIASLRYDKRGIAASKEAMGSEDALRFEDYIADAANWIVKLRSDKRFTRIAVIGHSEGSLIGMIAAHRARADMFVSLAGVSESADAVLRRQLISAPGGAADAAFPIIDSLASGKTVAAVPPRLAMLFRPSVQPYLISWFRYDPMKAIRDLQIPVLLVQGTTDLQVLEADARALKKAAPDAGLVIITGMNHVLKDAPSDRVENLKTYTDPAAPLSAGLARSIVSFLSR
ncbi:MAG: alpha/beta hydrolase [Candidatus Kapaibacterium sp.]